jgi:hypothetical protein
LIQKREGCNAVTKEEKCRKMAVLYNWSFDELMKKNDSQIDALFSACKNERNKLREKED